MSIPIPLDRTSSASLQEQIYSYIRNKILSGEYRARTRLPSTRELAESLKVSRNTIVLAYEWLASEGYVDSHSGAGTFVTSTTGAAARVQTFDPVGVKSRATAPPAYPEPVIPYELPELFTRNFMRAPVDFWYGRTDPRQFPTKIWRRLTIENILSISTTLVEYAPVTGIPSLRSAIAEHLKIAKGITCSPEQVIITAGAQEALNIISRLFIERGTRVAIECPGYASAVTLFKSFGASVHPLPIDDEGITVGEVPNAKPKLIYTTPSHQFPMGIIMSPARREELLSAAESVGAYVIEDDYDGEIIYDRPPVAALYAFDPGFRVLYLGSFSKSLGAGLRLGFIVVPPQLVEPVGAIKALSTYGQPWLEQATLASFIRAGNFSSHLRRLRTLFRARRDSLIQGLREAFTDQIRISGQEAGLHVVCTLPPEADNAAHIVRLGRDHGLGLYTLQDAGAYEVPGMNGYERSLIFGYASLTPSEIEAALIKLTRLLRGG